MSPYDADPPSLSLTRAQIAALEAEARRVLAEVEPDDAARERRAHREERECGYVLLAITGTGRERGSRTIEGDAMWRPRATRTRSGWAIAGGWLDAAVPELPTRGVPNAGGVSIVLPLAWSNAGSDAMYDRHHNALFTNVTRAGIESETITLQALLSPTPSLLTPLAKPAVAVRESDSVWQRESRDAREYPANGVGRGWCEGLNGNVNSAQPPTAKGWRMMRRYLATMMRTLDAAWTEERAAIVAAQSREAG